MSRWLSSVNNLLENLDGQAETVAETVAEQATATGISSNLRRLNNTLATNASALTSNITRSNNNNNNSETNSNVESLDEDYDSYDDDDSAFFEDDDEDFGDDEEFTTEEEDYADADADADTLRPTELVFQSTNNKLPDNPVSEDVNDAGQHQQQQQSGDVGSAADVPINQQQTSSLPTFYTPKQQQSPKESNDRGIVDGGREQKKGATALSGDAVNNNNVDDDDDDDDGVIDSFATPKKPSNEIATPKIMVRNPQQHGEISLRSSSNENKNKKEQEKSSVPNQPQLPPPQQNIVGSKPNPVATGSISNTNKHTKRQPGKKQGQDESKLLKKQQQQHYQVLTSKNKTIKSLESQLVKLREELTKGATERDIINQRTKDLDTKLQSSGCEIEAQANELIKAGEEMEQIRKNAKEEKEDLQDDHEDEMEDVQRSHQEALDKMRHEYETTIAEWSQRYESEESLRQQEGGDSIRELQDANKREREALIQLAAVTEERKILQTKLDTVVDHEKTLEEQVESSLGSAETVAAREQRARDELDEAAAQHAKQMAQRQRREAELEQTILEMGSALTLAKHQLRQASSHNKGTIPGTVPGSESSQTNNDGESSFNYKEQFEQVGEELETVKVRFTMETQRREALQQELAEVSEERAQELSLAQSRQKQYDRKVTDLESTIHQLQASIRAEESSGALGSSNERRALLSSPELLEGAKQEIANLSEQLYRQQVLAKNAKSEILALKGRVQAATARANDAEKAQYSNHPTITPIRSRSGYDVEGGGASGTPKHFSAKRRFKGGSSSRGVRSIRSALPCLRGNASGSGNGGGGGMEQLALTIDAIDSWMVDTGSFMRHEPFARLGLLLYLMVLHLWSFALVVFHTTEVEHGDFGSMDSSPRHWREHT